MTASPSSWKSFSSLTQRFIDRKNEQGTRAEERQRQQRCKEGKGSEIRWWKTHCLILKCAGAQLTQLLPYPDSSTRPDKQTVPRHLYNIRLLQEQFAVDWLVAMTAATDVMEGTDCRENRRRLVYLPDDIILSSFLFKVFFFFYSSIDFSGNVAAGLHYEAWLGNRGCGWGEWICTIDFHYSLGVSALTGAKQGSLRVVEDGRVHCNGLPVRWLVLLCRLEAPATEDPDPNPLSP